MLIATHAIKNSVTCRWLNGNEFRLVRDVTGDSPAFVEVGFFAKQSARPPRYRTFCGRLYVSEVW